MPYPEELLQPMREELTRVGVRELKTPAEVDGFFSQKQGTAMLVVNSVCGCAAGAARPGVALALQRANRPARVATVFAGQDVEAVAKARGYFADFPPSSPSLALFVDGKVVHFVPRHMIEGRTPEQVAADLGAAFDRHFRAGATAST